MQEILIRKLHEVITENNPELVQQLQENNSVTVYLIQKMEAIANALDAMLEQNQPAYIVEQACMELLTADLRPSRFHFIRHLLEEEFPEAVKSLQHESKLEATILQAIVQSENVFEQFSFSEETADDPFLRYTLLGLLEEHLDKTQQ